MTAIVKLLRWLLILPAAIAVVPAADWLTLELLDLLGTGGDGFLWLGGRVVGHVATGAAALLIGAWLAPARKQSISTILFILAVLGAIEAVAAADQDRWLMLLLAVSFLVGAWLALRKIRTSEEPEPTL